MPFSREPCVFFFFSFVSFILLDWNVLFASLKSYILYKLLTPATYKWESIVGLCFLSLFNSPLLVRRWRNRSKLSAKPNVTTIASGEQDEPTNANQICDTSEQCEKVRLRIIQFADLPILIPFHFLKIRTRLRDPISLLSLSHTVQLTEEIITNNHAVFHISFEFIKSYSISKKKICLRQVECRWPVCGSVQGQYSFFLHLTVTRKTCYSKIESQTAVGASIDVVRNRHQE